MAERPKIAAIVGSLRAQSFNRRLLALAVAAAERAGGEVTPLDLRDFPLPPFDADLAAAAWPEAATRLRQAISAQEALLIATPEYNAGVPGGLKNAIDWLSRSPANQADLSAFAGKAAAILSASTGSYGGARCLIQLRTVLTAARVLVVPEQFSLPLAAQAFNADGSLVNPAHTHAVEQTVRRLVEVTRALRPAGG